MTEELKETNIGMIPKEWELKSAEDFCSKVTDGTHDSPKKKDFGNYLITSRHIKGNDIDFENSYFISKEDYDEVNKRSRVDQWDVLFSMIGTIGETYLETNDTINYAIKNIGLFKSGAENRGKWIYYYLKSFQAQEYIHMNKSGTTQEYITLSALRNFPIAVPQNKKEMENIIDILYSIDRKIELNQKMNQTLEEIGQAIFKHWFVHFEFPNEEGKPYKSSGGEMVDSELGEIPKGWQVKKLGNVCNITMGQSPKSEFYNEDKEGLPFHQGVTNFGERFPNDKMYCTVENKIAEKGDILFSVRAPVGRINIANTKMVIGRGLCAIKHENSLQSFFLYQLKNIFTEEDSIGSGTVFNAVTRKDLDELLVLVPIINISKKLDSLTGSIDKEIENLTLQNNNLSQIRDSILPKLMSGKIRIS